MRRSCNAAFLSPAGSSKSDSRRALPPMKIDPNFLRMIAIGWAVLGAFYLLFFLLR